MGKQPSSWCPPRRSPIGPPGPPYWRRSGRQRPRKRKGVRARRVARTSSTTSTACPSDRHRHVRAHRLEEHTSELQSHSFISYAVFCLKKKKTKLVSRTTIKIPDRLHAAQLRQGP